MRRPVLKGVLVEKIAHARDLGGHQFERLHVYLDVEVAAIGENGSVPHLFHVMAVDYVDVARGGTENVSGSGCLGHRLDPEAIHGRLPGRVRDRPQ